MPQGVSVTHVRYDGGEWALLGVGLLLVGVSITLITLRLSKKFKGTPRITAIVFAVIGLGFGFGSLIAAYDHADTLNAKHDLQRQGFIVLEVNLGNVQDKVTLVGPNNCIVQRNVEHYADSGYRVVWDNTIGTPQTLTCKD